MRLIDASALMVAVEGNPLTTDSLKEYVRCVVREQQTVDAVPVIRCKDCKHRITANCERFGIKRYTQSDSFCSWAEQNEDEE